MSLEHYATSWSYYTLCATSIAQWDEAILFSIDYKYLWDNRVWQYAFPERFRSLRTCTRLVSAPLELARFFFKQPFCFVRHRFGRRAGGWTTPSPSVVGFHRRWTPPVVATLRTSCPIVRSGILFVFFAVPSDADSAHNISAEFFTVLVLFRTFKQQKHNNSERTNYQKTHFPTCFSTCVHDVKYIVNSIIYKILFNKIELWDTNEYCSKR